MRIIGSTAKYIFLTETKLSRVKYIKGPGVNEPCPIFPLGMHVVYCSVTTLHNISQRGALYKHEVEM